MLILLWSPVLQLCVCTLLVRGRGWSPEGQDVSPLSPQEHAVQAPGRRPARQLYPAMPPRKLGSGKITNFFLQNFDKILEIVFCQAQVKVQVKEPAILFD